MKNKTNRKISLNNKDVNSFNDCFHDISIKNFLNINLENKDNKAKKFATIDNNNISSNISQSNFKKFMMNIKKKF